MTGDPVPGGEAPACQVGDERWTARLAQGGSPWLAGLPEPGLAAGNGRTLAR